MKTHHQITRSVAMNPLPGMNSLIQQSNNLLRRQQLLRDVCHSSVLIFSECGAESLRRIVLRNFFLRDSRGKPSGSVSKVTGGSSRRGSRSESLPRRL